MPHERRFLTSLGIVRYRIFRALPPNPHQGCPRSARELTALPDHGAYGNVTCI